MTTQEKALVAGGLMATLDISARNIAEQTGLSYNTVLAYRRGSGDRLDLTALSQVASVLGQPLWMLFYRGELATPLVIVAQAMGIQDPKTPITEQDYKDLIGLIAQAAGAALTDSDFAPLPALVGGYPE